MLWVKITKESGITQLKKKKKLNAFLSRAHLCNEHFIRLSVRAENRWFPTRKTQLRLGCFFSPSLSSPYLNVGVSYVDFLERVLAAVSGAVGDAVAQEFPVNSIGMWGTPADVYGTRWLVMGGSYSRFARWCCNQKIIKGHTVTRIDIKM